MKLPGLYMYTSACWFRVINQLVESVDTAERLADGAVRHTGTNTIDCVIGRYSVKSLFVVYVGIFRHLWYNLLYTPVPPYRMAQTYRHITRLFAQYAALPHILSHKRVCHVSDLTRAGNLCLRVVCTHAMIRGVELKVELLSQLLDRRR